MNPLYIGLAALLGTETPKQPSNPVEYKPITYFLPERKRQLKELLQVSHDPVPDSYRRRNVRLS
jgi:hypothetical protein